MRCARASSSCLTETKNIFFGQWKLPRHTSISEQNRCLSWLLMLALLRRVRWQWRQLCCLSQAFHFPRTCLLIFLCMPLLCFSLHFPQPDNKKGCQETLFPSNAEVLEICQGVLLLQSFIAYWKIINAWTHMSCLFPSRVLQLVSLALWIFILAFVL